MRSLPLFLLLSATLAAALPAAAQTTPRRPPADTVRFGATRPSAGDSIRMAEYDEGQDAPTSAAVRGDDEADAAEDADTIPPKPRDGPYARARGTGPFSVQASGETAARPARGEVVWLEGRAARRDTSASARRDTARAGNGQRVASGQTARRDTASASGNRPARRDTASTATNRPARRDTASTASRPAARDTAGARRNGQSASTTTGNRPNSTSTTGTTTGRNGSASTSSSTSANNGRTGSNSSSSSSNTSGRTGSTSSSSSSSGSRARSHTVASGETFYGIARRYGVTAAQLRALNPDVEQDDLEVGDVLRLPASARDSRASGSSSSSSSSGSQGRTGAQTQPRQGAQGQRRSHTVAAGETLFGIARRYGVSVDAIREANDMEGDQVRTGQRLVIPPAR
ncbi:LysM peptidoglycan-binding domain-containing protein [Longimicrobium sp.]|uniref:LysM peptidoglycan-binding domain-containing protein n=1 Tax=Longimicrobium sp. TaxID=2029185 RepID=UPI002E32852F|nr:LysM peptidoglycan-binding domain-containing protein [Longimicrobium sp.]HEX6037524.1 LysM peptidoglycan-binding domain-containing protein [Longimicrobium sp.]